METFGECELDDRQRTTLLVKLADQTAARPDGSTPAQTESWGGCEAAYRLFNQDDVTFNEIVRPHCAQSCSSCRPGDVKLILNDTSEVDFGCARRTSGLGPTGNGFGRRFFLHSALMVDSRRLRRGLAGQELYYRQPKPKRLVMRRGRCKFRPKATSPYGPPRRNCGSRKCEHCWP